METPYAADFALIDLVLGICNRFPFQPYSVLQSCLDKRDTLVFRSLWSTKPPKITVVACMTGAMIPVDESFHTNATFHLLS